VQPTDPGWIDLAANVPLLDIRRARAELGWHPTSSGPEVLKEIVQGIGEAASTKTPVLRPRTVADQVATAFRKGPVSHRREP